ncbi:hypothetical protein GCM10011576_41790 [Micromonospora parathelypteridis]|uniref:Transposase n=1 Tax=Micromonospora parathelypteridis TaxID=1839617 RepID=A0A840W6D6_9ACTN|nr:transposase [Micromonospora parathelypteridis]GGO22445.1 hypothetical protein GCM10011576_41790 [Micromonospora parathelypteridis]
MLGVVGGAQDGDAADRTVGLSSGDDQGGAMDTGALSDSEWAISDLSDRQWALIDPFLQAWKAKRPSPSGHEGRYPLRAIVNAIFYQNRTGCQWMYLPNDLPPRSAVYYYFRLWRDDGTDQAIHDLLLPGPREGRPRRGPVVAPDRCILSSTMTWSRGPVGDHTSCASMRRTSRQSGPPNAPHRA